MSATCTKLADCHPVIDRSFDDMYDWTYENEKKAAQAKRRDLEIIDKMESGETKIGQSPAVVALWKAVRTTFHNGGGFTMHIEHARHDVEVDQPDGVILEELHIIVKEACVNQPLERKVAERARARNMILSMYKRHAREGLLVS